MKEWKPTQCVMQHGEQYASGMKITPQINVDVDGDYIPDINIDTNGDMKANLNISKSSNKADINVLPLTKWEPDQNYTYQNFAYDTMTWKMPLTNYDSDGDGLPDINIDLDGDGIADINITRPGEKKPYLNIDTDGDGIADINITRKDETVIPGKTEPYLNIIDPAFQWNPTKEIDFDGDGKPDFRTDASLSAILSIDSNNDHIPDLNIDTNGDYIADLNINVKGDKKSAQTNIDSDGDGIADINIDIDGDGKPDSMIASKYQWNPTFMVKDESGKILYGTTANIAVDTIDSLVDNGIVMKPNDSDLQFLPNYAIKVTDITKDADENKKAQIIKASQMADKEVVKIYDIQMLIDHVAAQPDGSVQISIPYSGSDECVLMMKQKDGTYVKVASERKGAYITYTTDYLGEVSILSDKRKTDADSKTDPTKQSDDDKSNVPTAEKQEPTIQKPLPAQNTLTGYGGASTGDVSDVMLYQGIACLSMGILLLLQYKRKTRR